VGCKSGADTVSRTWRCRLGLEAEKKEIFFLESIRLFPDGSLRL